MLGVVASEHSAQSADHFKSLITCFFGLPPKFDGEKATAVNDGVGAPFRPLSMLYENPGDLPFNRVHHFLIPREDLHTTNRDLDRPTAAIGLVRAGSIARRRRRGARVPIMRSPRRASSLTRIAVARSSSSPPSALSSRPGETNVQIDQRAQNRATFSSAPVASA